MPWERKLHGHPSLQSVTPTLAVLAQFDHRTAERFNQDRGPSTSFSRRRAYAHMVLSLSECDFVHK